ncbi:unnamed protein product [Bursaphelenchus okinawaensis]|uniref:Transmembrane protein 127 transmembrane region domain-containing protein n=1 Tax=Bursaphelenchus okinawaensis TaxID=465554 RepID=A0A811KJI9_9BILA|nr:unnamed protein product [Bursaphelenchus okinawaensis]CAG9104215.1 unnamed protein product [Bursaphelenchus okinawaensis]
MVRPGHLLLLCDSTEVNVVSSVFNFLTATLAVCALVSNDWLLLNNGELNDPRSLNESLYNNTWDDFLSRIQNDELNSLNIVPCDSIGSKHFWLPARFGSFVEHNNRHLIYSYNHSSLIDCISPTVANYFYVIIALCFVVVTTSSFAAVLHFMAPPFGFFVWLKVNSTLEICNCFIAIMTLLACFLSRAEVQNLRPEAFITFGFGFLLMVSTFFLSLISACHAQRKQMKLRKTRRVTNQRLMCTRTLRSWRNVTQRSEDTRPIINFERYLLEPGLRSPSVATISTTADGGQDCHELVRAEDAEL